MAHHAPEDIIRILALGESGRMALPDLYKKERISKASYYRWRSRYIRSEQEREWILEAAQDLGQCQAILRRIHRSRNPIELGHEDDDGRQDGEEPISAEDWYLIEKSEEARFAKQAAEAAEQQKQFQKLLKARQPIETVVAPRVSKQRVQIPGRLPLGAHTTLSLHLAQDLHWRLTREVGGSLNQSINALLRYALDCLDAEDYMLYVFDGSKPRPQLRMTGPRVKRIPTPEDLQRKEDLRKAIRPPVR